MTCLVFSDLSCAFLINIASYCLIYLSIYDKLKQNRIRFYYITGGLSMKTDVMIQELVDSYGSWVRDEADNKAGNTGRMTKNLYPYDSMFSPIEVNSITLKNRIVMAPMGNIDMCEETGRPNDKMLQYFFAR